jgi:hypothetical protein
LPSSRTEQATLIALGSPEKHPIAQRIRQD